MIRIYITILIALLLSVYQFGVHAEEKEAEQPIPSAVKNNGIIIHGRPVPNIEKSTTSSTIDENDVTEHSDKTLDDSLKNVPGLQVGMHKKGHMRASFRGFDQNRVAILIDGTPLNDIYSTDIDISEIPVTGISEIIIQRGAASALYGASGGVGIINIITRRPDTPYCNVKLEYGLYNNSNVSVSAGAPAGSVYFNLAGEYDHSSGYEVSAKLDKAERRKWFDKLIRYDLYGLEFEDVILPAKNDYINDTGKLDHTEHDRYSVSGKMIYTLSKKNEAGINGSYSFKKSMSNSYQGNAISNYKNSSGDWSDPVFDTTSDPTLINNASFRNRSFVWPEIHNASVSPYFKSQIGDLLLRGNFYATYKSAVQEKYASTDHSWPGDTVLADTAYEPYKTIKEYASCGVNLNPSYRIAYWNRLNLAFMYKKNIYNESEQAISAEESPAIAATIFGLDPYPVKRLEASGLTAAIENELNFSKLDFTIGISYDAQFFSTFKNREALYQFDDAYIVKNDSSLLGTKDSWNPVAGLTYTPVNDFILLRMAGSIKTRFPDLSEYSLIVDDKRDNGLKPERSYNFNTGIEFLFLDRLLSFRNDYFISRVKDRIEKISGGIEPPVNIGEVVSQGIESIITYESLRIAKIFTLKTELSYTYIHARMHDNTHEEKVNKGDYIENTPVHQFCADVRLRFITGTLISFWGYSTVNQITYAMKKRPEPFPAKTDYSTDYFEPVRLHDPVMFNIRIAQKIFNGYEIYIMCKNIFDDYNADPFIPGPGRIFYAGGSAEF